MTLGYAGRLFAVRLPHRGDHALDPAAARVVLTGVRQVAAAGSEAGVGELAVLLDPAGFPEFSDDVGEQVALVLPLSSEDADFQLASDHGFGAQLEAAGATVAHVEVRWGPDHDPGAKKSQAVELTRLAAWLHETGRVLLVELAVPGLGGLAGEARSDELLKTVREIREVGVEADLWAVPGPLDDETAERLGELVRDAGRDDVGILVTDHDLRSGADAADPGVGSIAPGAVGFVLGPEIWSDALGRRRDGEVGDDAAATLVADRLRQKIATVGGSKGT
ncbi:MAG TPA: DUF2090 domain-containing protein [Egicoccus sp.]|nr:DUF2090 domain-containing protein [Egicoccus sp.]HSK23261.1 DUF2090 domain-containing protein [Egicoccus sp.]